MLPRAHALALAAFGVLFLATWWRPIWPAEQALHHSLTVLAVLGLVLIQRRVELPLPSWLLALTFLALHTVAARWLYSNVPYADWIHALTGYRLSGGRNQFDRLVHLVYGLCLAPILLRYLVERRDWRLGWAALVSVDVVLSTGALYEIFEWLVARTFSPETAEAYNGQQGDLWDPQKDMAIAAIGAVIGAGVAWATARRWRSTA